MPNTLNVRAKHSMIPASQTKSGSYGKGIQASTTNYACWRLWARSHGPTGSNCYKLKRALHGCYAASILETHGAHC